MPRWPRPLELVLETIPCDFSELLVGHLYNLYKSKRARKFALLAPPTMQICEGASFPRRMLGLLSWSYRPTCSANESDPSRRGGPAFHPRSLFPKSSTVFYFSESLYRSTLHDILFLRGTLFLLFPDTFFIAAFKMGVKIVRTITAVMFLPRCPSFGTSREFVSTEPFYLLALRDSLFRPSRFIVRRFTIVRFDRAALSLELHDRLVSTEPHYLSALHDSLFFCTNSSRSNFSNCYSANSICRASCFCIHPFVCVYTNFFK